MGMFDSMYDRNGQEWQTKAFHCDLDRFIIGDEMPAMDHFTYQVRVLGSVPESGDMDLIHTLATIRHGRLTSINDERDTALPLLDYQGGWVASEREMQWT